MKDSERLIKSYLEDVIGPMEEPAREMMTDSFQSGRSVGLFQAAEKLNDLVGDLKAQALAVIAIRNQEGKGEHES